jgi:hypothetical protein
VLGEHTAAVLHRYAGIEEDQLSKLKSRGII